MGRAPLVNPIILSPDNEELHEAFERLIEQLERRADRQGQTYVIPLRQIGHNEHVQIIPRVAKDGFNLGRISLNLGVHVLPTGTMRDLTASSTAYWTFTLSRYFTATNGVRTKRPIPNGTWNTSEVGIRADLPKVVEVKHPLNPGESLVLDIAKTGAAEVFSGSIQVQEIFGPED